jgi:uncharacterized repeat protein (TIGR01451 family)
MNRFRLIRFALGITAIFALILITNVTQSPLAATGPSLFTDELRQEIEKYGEIPIIITLDVHAHRAWQEGDAAGSVDLAQIEQVSQAITAAADGVLNRLPAENISQIKRYDYFPLLAMIVDEAALEALATDKAVTQIALDVPLPPLMDDTIPLIGANNNHFLNYTGSGWSVAILDTGVQKNHPALFGKVISEACYSTTFSGHGATSLCPDGASNSTAPNSGLNCALGISGCDHGTHVAGIAARVAPDARLISIQVFSRFADSGSNTPCQNVNRTSPCTLSYSSDQALALDRVWNLHVTNPSINVASANMSLGGGFYTGPCDNITDLNGVRIAINQLRNVNVATVIAAGNSGYRGAMGAPACLTPAISVAASDKSDQVASFSNISPFTTLIAPGTPILAPVPTNLTPIYQLRGGTSMAAPHVAGAIATLKEAQPNATVPQLITALTNTNSPLITDNRSGGFVSKRRLNTWFTLCALISCDGDDFRTIGTNQTLYGAIAPAGDVDHYYYFGTVGQRLTLRMNRTSGSHDPYLELYSPAGFRVAFNDNGGGGVNALINGYLLPQSGMYQIRARSVNNSTGGYQIITSTESEPLNPVPQISHLSPGWVYGSFFGSDFWVAIYGSNFMPESQVRINGQLRAKFYSSPTLIYIRVLGGDIYWPWPRNAWITVVNPTPGGGTSNSRALPIYDPFLGESQMMYPESGSSVSAGVSQSFVISWTAPITTTTWRDMQYMDMRLRDETGEIAAWVRVVEQPGANSFYRLLNASEEIVGEGMPGENVTLVLTDTVSLNLAESSFSGSGLTAIMTPTLTFGPAAIGTYNVEFRVDSKSGGDDDPNAQDGDVLGVFTVLPEGCEVAIADITISGPGTGEVGMLYAFNTAVSPPNATIPITTTWTPEPNTGQGFPNAAYSFDQAGEYIVGAQAENCGAFAAGIHTIRISSGPDPDLSISKTAPATSVADQPITYTLTIANSGAMTATNLLVRDTLPSGGTYLGGGTLVGNEVQWNLAELGGYGQTAVVSFTVSAANHIVNNQYSVEADGGFGSQSSSPVETKIVDAQIQLTAVTSGTLSYTGSSHSSQLYFPGGSVFADTIITYDELSSPPNWDDGVPYAGRAFHLNAYQNDILFSNFRLYETADISLSYDPADLNGIREGSLTLYYWENDGWQQDGVSCTTDSSNQVIHCQVNTPLLTSYALAKGSYSLYLPTIINQFPPSLPYAQISGITLSGEDYAVTFQTYGFVPQMPGQHVHFFFDTVPPEEAGVPGAGPWFVYAGPSPFTGYGTADRPQGANQMCILVANQDHSVIQGTGNCYNLP